MILQIDVEVTGPDQVMTGSVAVDVEVPEDSQSERPVTGSDLANLRLRQRSQALRWSQR